MRTMLGGKIYFFCMLLSIFSMKDKTCKTCACHHQYLFCLT